MEENSGYIINQPLAPNVTNQGLIRPFFRLLSILTPKILEEFPFYDLIFFFKLGWLKPPTNYRLKGTQPHKNGHQHDARGVCLSCQYFTLYHLHLPGLHSRYQGWWGFRRWQSMGGQPEVLFFFHGRFSTENALALDLVLERTTSNIHG